MSRLYTVYDNKTDMPLIIDGTAKECAEAMHIKAGSFYSVYTNQKKRKVRRWSIIMTSIGQPYPSASTFGSKLRNNRIKQGLTLKDLELRSGITYQAINQIELGKREPSLFTAKCLCDALKLSLDYLAGRDKYYKHTEVQGDD